MPLLDGCKVLIIEDEYFLADDIARAIRSHGADVVGPIGELDEAVEQVRRGNFDVAVLDINLRDQAAYPIAEQLEHSAIPFMFVTGYSAEIIPQRFRHVTRLEKPWNIDEMLQNVLRLCRCLA